MSNEVIQETTPLVECSAFHRGMSVLEASLRNTEDSEAIINGLLKGAAEFYGASRASVVEADWELGIGVITYEWCKDGVPAQRDMLQCLPMEKFPRWRKSLRANKPVVISDLQRLEKIYPDEAAFFQAYGVTTLLAAPFSKRINQGFIAVDAHKEIAFEFASWISVEFKLYLVKEFERLKTEEMKQLGWDIKRNLAKINYRIHTDAIKENLIPPELSARQISLVYANEADVLNMALFGMTAKQWRDSHPDLKGNIRDYANVSQLVCLSNLENLNAVFINEGISQSERLAKLNAIAISQMKVLTEDHRLLQLEAADDTEKPQ